MAQVAQLWIPIVLSAVLVFVASSLIHMLFKWHNSEYGKLANEDAVRAAVRAGSPAPGQYVLPFCREMKEMQSPEMQQKYVEGPVGFLVLRAPGAPKMGGFLVKWLIYNLVVAFLAGCLTLHMMPAGNGSQAGLVAGSVSFLAYAGGSIPNAIWMGKPWTAALKELLDALIYGAVTAAAFTWLWPH